MDSADLRRKRSGVLFLAGRTRIPSPLSSSQAILDAVARFGYEFRKRRQNERKLDIAIHGVPYVIDILQWFPFTTERKRTTVVVRFRQQLFLFCKVFVAVDSSAGSRLRRPSPSGTGGARQRVRWSFHRLQQSSSVSNARLRWKASFRDWEQTLLSAGSSASSVPESLQRQLEADQRLEGAIAIQDDLAADVFISIRKLQAAGIRFWILTGDKADTAEAIAFAAGVVHPTQHLVRLTARSLQAVGSLACALRETLESLSEEDSYSVLVDEFVMDCVFRESNEVGVWDC